MWWERRSRFALARRSPKSCVAAGPVACSGSVSFRLGNAYRTQQHPHTVAGTDGDGSGRRDTPSARAYHALRSHRGHLHPRMSITPKERTTGEGAMQRPPLGRTTIYYDDVSSGPRPRAHWYMLTHRAATTRLPTGPRIALHRVPIPPLHHYCA